MKHLILTAACALLAGPAFADLQVTFDEGAPKDRFTVQTVGGCGLGPSDIRIDLSGSAAGLVFDVTASGAGVEVFQPFELTAGASNLTSVPMVTDGQTEVVLPVSGLTDSDAISFTIDVDDTMGGREITVSRAEISGARVEVSMAGKTYRGTFGDDAVARVAVPGCIS